MAKNLDPTRDMRRIGAAILQRHQAFMLDDVIIDLAAADAAHTPLIAIGLGCRIALARGQLSVLVAREQSRAFVDAVHVTRRVAVTFGKAPDHVAIQLKGVDCCIEPPARGDAKLAERYRQALTRQFSHLGFTSVQTDIFLGVPITDPVIIRFTPTAVFLQTPGPQAGERLS